MVGNNRKLAVGQAKVELTHASRGARNVHQLNPPPVAVFRQQKVLVLLWAADIADEGGQNRGGGGRGQGEIARA